MGGASQAATPPTQSGRPDAAALRALFEPRSIALVGLGASNPMTTGMIRSLRAAGYDGDLHLVHPAGAAVDGVPCATDLGQLDHVPDLAVLMLRAERAVDGLRAAAEAGARAAVIFDGGFGEAGPEGAARQHELVAVAREHGMAVLGPNCLGFVNLAAGAAAYLEEVQPAATPGRIALIAQSGMVGSQIAKNVQGIRWSHIVTTGNEAVTDAADVIDYLVGTEARAICLFLETIRRPDAFFAACDRAIAAGKPVAVLKAGRSPEALAVAAAHTGALAREDRLVDALLQRHGIARADSIEELLAIAALLQTGRRPRGPRVGLVTGSGGMIELVLDEASELELEFPPVGPDTAAALQEVAGDERVVHNPFDLWPNAVGMDEAVKRSVAALAADPAIDVLAFQSEFQTLPVSRDGTIAYGVEHVVAVAAASEKTFVDLDVLPAGIPVEHVDAAAAAGVAMLTSGLRANLRAIAKTVQRAAREPRAIDAAAEARLARAVQLARAALAAGELSGLPALEVLRAAGLPIAASVAVDGVEVAVAAAREIGFPLVLKDGDPANLHKTETGGVMLGLEGEDDVRAAAEQLWAGGVRRFLLQAQKRADNELLLGLKSDPELGSFVVLGSGGVWTEILDDVVLRPVGLGEGEAREMLESLRAFPVLAGARGRPPAALDLVVELIERVDDLGARLGTDLGGLDVNPVLVGPDDAICVDAVLVPPGG